MFCGNCGADTSTKFCRACGSANEIGAGRPEDKGFDSDTKVLVQKNLPATLLLVAAAIVTLFGLITLGNAGSLGAELTKTVTAIETAKGMYEQADRNFLEWKTNLDTCEAGSLAKYIGCSYQEKMMNDFGGEMAFHLTKLQEFVDHQENLVSDQNQGYISGAILLALGALLFALGFFKRKSHAQEGKSKIPNNLSEAN
jgi:hypothetical protein